MGLVNMKKIVGSFALLLFLSACSSSDKKEEESKPEQKTETASQEKDSDLKFETVLMDLFESPAKSNSFRIGERMNLTIQNMTGFIARNGFYELGLKLDVLDDKDSLIISVSDLFEVGTHKFPVSDPVNLSFHVDFFKPYEPNKTYNIGMFVWDKVGGKHIQLNQKVNIMSHQENGFIKLAGDIPVDHIITYRNGKVYTGNTYYQDEILFFNIGLSSEYLKSHPAITTSSGVYNQAGEEILVSNESATLQEDSPPFNNYVVLKKEKYPPGSYYFEQVINDVKSGSKELKITYPFDITEEPE